MQLSTDLGPLGNRRRGVAGGWPARAEAALVLGAIALLLPQFARVADLGSGRGQRFDEPGLRITGMPEPILPAVCAAHGLGAEPLVRDSLCGSSFGVAATPLGQRLPPALEQAALAAGQALLEPLRQAQVRLERLRQPQQDGSADLREAATAAALLEAELQPHIDAFQLADADATGPLPLGCALRWAEAALAEPEATPAQRGEQVTAQRGAQAAAQANAVLLVAAALDGRSATAALAGAALLPGTSSPTACASGAVASLAATAGLMESARQSMLNARKNEAVLALLPAAGTQWAGAMLLGFILMVWSRRAPRPALGVAASLALWALAAWLARVPWPFSGKRGFEPARLTTELAGPPADFVLWLAAAAALLLVWAGFTARKRPGPAPAQAMSSRIGYPGLVLATGLGALLLLDLSANAHPVNRYLALYHQGHLWFGLLVFSVLLFLRQPLSRGLGRGLAIAGDSARALARWLGPGGAPLLLIGAALAALMLFSLLLTNLRQFTSELGRVWLIVGAAWFFFLRGGPLAERLARAGPAAVSVGRYLAPLLFVAGVLVGAMLVTRDMGPLLIAGYAAGAFVAASAAMWWHLRSGRRAAPLLLAVSLFAAWIGAVTLALFQLGSVDAVTAARLESLAAPFASTNDQAALVAWFQLATPPGGFGIGSVPWCGFVAAGRCAGVPAQIHSDYSFTAIVGVFGPLAAWAAAIGAALWLHRLVRHHGRVTRGEPRFVARRAGVGAQPQITSDGQALLSWIGVAWVALTLCQLAVTVAGNLALLPLTGVTFPFVSFGMTSLVVNLAFLALCLNVDLPEADR